MKENITVDPQEISHFSAMAEEWWDPHGKFKPLHDIAPHRLAFLRDHIAAHFGRDIATDKPFEGLGFVDIGSGGGLICEPMCRLGAQMTGVDAAAKNVHIASTHAQEMELDITYLNTTAEALAMEGVQFDVVFALEIVEHVADVPAFLAAISALVKPGGLLFMSTLNRTLKSYAFAIVGAEYVLRWLPRGTHHWNKFLRPSELVLPLEKLGIDVTDMTGLVFNPLSREWRLDVSDLDVNYMLVGKK